jgi:ribosomal subunit interface protein
MELPLQITFRDMDPSEAMEQAIRERAAKLDRFCDRIMACRVVVEPKYRHHRQGNAYHVRIDLTVPGQELVVSHDPGPEEAHQDAYVAIRDAFGAAERQLEDYVRRQRGDVKTHEELPHGQIAQLNPEGDFGLIEVSDGRLVLFSRDSVAQAGFDALRVGDAVRFVEEPGGDGGQALAVTPEGRH